MNDLPFVGLFIWVGVNTRRFTRSFSLFSFGRRIIRVCHVIVFWSTCQKCLVQDLFLGSIWSSTLLQELNSPKNKKFSNIFSSGYRYAHAAQDLATANKAFAPEIPRAPYSFHGSCVVMALLKVWVDSKNMGDDHVLDTTIWVENRALLHYFRQDTELWSLDWRPARPPLLSSLMCPQWAAPAPPFDLWT